MAQSKIMLRWPEKKSNETYRHEPRLSALISSMNFQLSSMKPSVVRVAPRRNLQKPFFFLYHAEQHMPPAPPKAKGCLSSDSDRSCTPLTRYRPHHPHLLARPAPNGYFLGSAPRASCFSCGVHSVCAWWPSGCGQLSLVSFFPALRSVGQRCRKRKERWRASHRSPRRAHVPGLSPSPAPNRQLTRLK